MRKQGTFTLYSLDEVQDKVIGRRGTPRRDRFEREVDEALNAYRLGEAVKQARKGSHLTQKQLGERAGVKPAQVSSIERGKSIRSLGRVLRALGETGELEIAGQKIALG